MPMRREEALMALRWLLNVPTYADGEPSAHAGGSFRLGLASQSG
ncbi:hypothetical protein N9V91_02340 [Acidimicrobiaceae bacterium]|nr:hypothetical protein [Acidimicrobiaceae bacterium]